MDAIDIARALGDRENVRKATNDARKQRYARRARLALMKQLMAEIADNLRTSTSLKRLPTPIRKSR